MDRRDVSPELFAELHWLTAASLSGELTAAQASRLEELLGDTSAQRLYLELVFETHTLLTWADFPRMGSPQHPTLEGAPVPPTSTVKPPASPVLGFLGGVMDYISHSRRLMFWLICGTLGLYFAVQLGSLILGRFWAQNAPLVADNGGAGTEKRGPADGLLAPGDAGATIVARLTGAVDCQWQFAAGAGASAPAVPLGTEFCKGQKLRLSTGLAELTFDSGATVILRAPARFDVTDPNGGRLQVGKLTAKVPHSAAGFAISTPGGKVVDRGTEFGVSVNDDGKMNVIVYVGEVQVESGSRDPGGVGADQPKVVHVKAGQAVTVQPGQTAKPTPPENERFIRDLTPLEDKTQLEAAYVAFVKTLKPAVWFRMEGKRDDRALHDEMGGLDAKLVWDGAADPFVNGQLGKALWLRGGESHDYAVVPKYPQADRGTLTVSAWVFADGRPGNATIVANWNRGRGQFCFSLGPHEGKGGRDLCVTVPKSNHQPLYVCREGPDQHFPLKVWQHVAFTIDGHAVKLFRQGREVARGSFPGLAYPVDSKVLTIGATLRLTPINSRRWHMPRFGKASWTRWRCLTTPFQPSKSASWPIGGQNEIGLPKRTTRARFLKHRIVLAFTHLRRKQRRSFSN